MAEGSGNGWNPPFLMHCVLNVGIAHGQNGVPFLCCDGLHRYWSGRKNVMQNRDYDHTDIFDIVDQIVARGDESELAQSAPMIVNDGEDIDLLQASIRTSVHSTPFGFCVGNLTFEPCTRALTCTSCTRLVCIVGNMDQTANIEADILRRRKSVQNLNAMENNGRRVNPRMKTQMEAQLKHAETLLSILNDPKNEGSIIKNAGVHGLVEFNQGLRAFDARHRRSQKHLSKEEGDFE